MVSVMTSPGTQTRIAQRFAELRASGELGLVAYITAGDPSLDATLKFVLALAEAGPDVIEPAVPFIDPLAHHRRILAAQPLDTISLGAPPSTDERLAKIAAVSSGFLYLISRTGVTGAKDALPDDLPALIRRARAVTQLPIAVGFGISLPGHVSVLGGLADAAVVGSALVSQIDNTKSVEAASAPLTAHDRLLQQAAPPGLSRREVAP